MGTTAAEFSRVFHDVDHLQHDNFILEQEVEKYKRMLQEENREHMAVLREKKELDQRYNDLNREHMTQMQLYDSLNTEHEQLKAKHARRMEELAQQINEIDDARQQSESARQDLDSELKVLTKRLEEDRFERLYQARKEAQEEFEKLKEALAFEFGAENRKKAAELEAFRRRMEEQLSARDSSRHKSAQLDLGNRRMTSALNETRTKLRTTTEQLRGAEKERLRLQRELAELQAQYSTDVPKWKTKYIAEHRSREDLEANNERISTQMHKLESKLATTSVEFKSCIKERNDLQDETEKMKKTITQNEARIQSQEQMLATLRSTVEERQHQMAQLESETSEIKQQARDEVREIRRKLHNEISVREEVTAERNKALEELASLEEKTNTSVEELAKTRVSIETHHSIRDSMDAELKDSRKELQALTAKITTLTHAKETAESELVKVKGRLEAELRLALNKQTELQSVAQTAKNMREQDQTEVEALRVRMHAVEEARATAEKAQELAERELTDARAQSRKQAETYKEASAKNEESVKKLQAQLESLNEELAEKERLSLAQDRKLRTLASEAKTKQDDAVAAVTAQLEHKKKELDATVETLESRLSVEKQARQKLEAERTQLKADRLAVTHQLEEVSEQLIKAEKARRKADAELFERTHSVEEAHVMLTQEQMKREDARLETTKLEEKVRNLQRELNVRDAEVKELSAAHRDRTVTRDMLALRDTELAQMAEEVAKLKLEKGEAAKVAEQRQQGVLQKNKDLQRMLDEAEEKLAAQKRTVETLESECDEAHRKTRRKEQELLGAQEKAETLTAEVARLNAASAARGPSDTAAPAIDGTLTSLTSSLNAAEQRLLESELARRRAEERALHWPEEKAAMETELRQLQRTTIQQEGTIKALTSEKVRLRDELDALLAARDGDSSMVRDQLADALKRTAAAERARAKAESERDNLVESRARLEADTLALRTEIVALRAETGAKEGDALSTLTQSLSAARADLVAADRSKAALKDRVAQLEEELETSKARLLESEERLAAVTAERRDLETKYNIQQRNYETMQEQSKRLRADFSELNQTVDQKVVEERSRLESLLETNLKKIQNDKDRELTEKLEEQQRLLEQRVVERWKSNTSHAPKFDSMLVKKALMTQDQTSGNLLDKQANFEKKLKVALEEKEQQSKQRDKDYADNMLLSKVRMRGRRHSDVNTAENHQAIRDLMRRQNAADSVNELAESPPSSKRSSITSVKEEDVATTSTGGGTMAV